MKWNENKYIIKETVKFLLRLDYTRIGDDDEKNISILNKNEINLLFVL